MMKWSLLLLLAIGISTAKSDVSAQAKQTEKSIMTATHFLVICMFIPVGHWTVIFFQIPMAPGKHCFMQWANLSLLRVTQIIYTS